MNIPKTIAIDYGEKYYGLAVTDELGILAVPLTTLVASTQDKFFAQFRKVVANHQPAQFLIGLPLGLDNKPTQTSVLVEKFAIALDQKFQLPHKFWNETLTSKIAEAKKSKQSTASHSEAARIMLQEYLDYLHTGI